MAMPY